MYPGTAGPSEHARHGESVQPTALGVACDQLACPAPALHRVDVFDQDFYFCHHHWLELEPVLGTLGTGKGRERWLEGVLGLRGPGLGTAPGTESVPVA